MTAPLPPYVPPPWPELTGTRRIALQRLALASAVCGVVTLNVGVVIALDEAVGAFFILIGAIVMLASGAVWRRPSRARALRAAWGQIAGAIFSFFVLLMIVVASIGHHHHDHDRRQVPTAEAPPDEDEDDGLGVLDVVLATGAFGAMFSGPVQLVAFMVLFRLERRHQARGGLLPEAVVRS